MLGIGVHDDNSCSYWKCLLSLFLSYVLVLNKEIVKQSGKSSEQGSGDCTWGHGKSLTMYLTPLLMRKLAPQVPR